MKNRYVVLSGLIVLALLCTAGTAAVQADNTTGMQVTETSGDIQPYNGLFGPDSALYELKIGMENLDEVFTFNESERVEKQLNHAMLRIAEVRRELELNRTGSAERALELYWQKVNLTENTLNSYASNTTGLLHAQEMIAKHQVVLANLLLSHPNNTGLMRAYNNSLVLEQKFEQKTEIRFERIMEKNNKTILKAVRLEMEKWNKTGEGEGEYAGNEVREREEIREKTKEQKHATPEPTITVQPALTGVTPSVTAMPQEVQTPSNGTQKKNGKDNADDKGHGRSRDK